MAKKALVKLSELEIESLIKRTPGWHVKGGKLSRQFSFDRYLLGLTFGSAVGYQAEQMQHHPEVLIEYCKVTVSVNTHDVGGISQLDFDLAEKVSALVD